MAENGSNYEEAIAVVKEYETIIRSQKKGIPNIAFSQGKIFKRFKDFVERTKELGVRQLAVCFKPKLLENWEKYPNLKKSSLSLNFLKHYLKTIKYTYKERGSTFNQFY